MWRETCRGGRKSKVGKTKRLSHKWNNLFYYLILLTEVGCIRNHPKHPHNIYPTRRYI